MVNKAFKAVVDDGTREIPLVNKFGKTICNVYFRPADFSIIDRYNRLVADFDSIIKPLQSVSMKNDGTAVFEDDWAVVKQVEDELKKKLNELFDMEEADAIFEKRNPFSSVGGEFFCSRVLQALGGVITGAIAEESKLSQKRMAKYLTDIEPITVPGVTPDAGDITAES